MKWRSLYQRREQCRCCRPIMYRVFIWLGAPRIQQVMEAKGFILGASQVASHITTMHSLCSPSSLVAVLHSACPLSCLSGAAASTRCRRMQSGTVCSQLALENPAVKQHDGKICSIVLYPKLLELITHMTRQCKVRCKRDGV